MKQPKDATFSDISDRHAPADPRCTLRTPCLNEEPDEDFPSANMQSATECTGLMPAMPDTAQQQAQLASLMAIHCPPSATPEDQAGRQSAGEAVHPCGGRSQPTNQSTPRPSTESDRSHRH